LLDLLSSEAPGDASERQRETGYRRSAPDEEDRELELALVSALVALRARDYEQAASLLRRVQTALDRGGPRSGQQSRRPKR